MTLGGICNETIGGSAARHAEDRLRLRILQGMLGLILF